MMEHQYLGDILILLAAAIITIPFFQRLGLGSILGYLTAGAIIGPWGFGFIDQLEQIRRIAEFGVIFLLFSVGIELKPARLWTMRRLVFGLGTAQVLLTGLVLTGVAILFELAPGTAVILGFGLALSSTTFGLQILGERGEMNTAYGRMALSTLLLQDLAVVPLLALVAILAAESSLVQGAEFAILQAALVIGLVILAGRYLLTPILRLVASSRTAEVFMAAAVFAALGTAWLMEEVGLSMALGAFLAGLMLAESHYRHQVIADIQPFRGILLGLFFMGVGMSIDFGLLGQHAFVIASLVAGLLLLKGGLLWLLCRIMGAGTADAVRVALLLSQSGEFGFVIFGLAAANGVLPEDQFRMLTLLVVLSMVTTPLMANLGVYLNRYLMGPGAQHDVSADHIDADQPHVIIAGFGRVGRRLASILRDASVPYLAIEHNPDHVLKGRREGFSVFYGDASQVDVLKAAGAGRADVLVCTVDKMAPAVRLVNIMRQHYPDITIHTRGRDSEHCALLLEAGATLAISETLEASLQLGEAVLSAMGIFPEDAEALTDAFRNDYYE